MPATDPVVAARPDQSPDLRSLEAGLDALGRRSARRRIPVLRRCLRSALPPLVGGLSVLAVWQLAVWAQLKPAYVLPAPADVARTLADQWQQGHITGAVWTSLRRGVLGFVVSVVVATPLGLAVARLRPLRAALAPVLSGLQGLPSVAWVPAAIIWFGLSDAAIYFVVLLGAVPSITNGLVAGLDQVPPLHRRVGQVLGARGLVAARWVLLPAALPSYLAGLKQGWAFAWRSLMAAELITFSPKLGLGLGQLLDTGRQLSDMSLVVTAILVIFFVGIGVDRLVFAPIERRVLRRRGLLAGA